MAAPSEGGRSFCEGMQDELGDVLMRTVNIISNFFEMLDLDKNGNVELADLHRMQVCLYLHIITIFQATDATCSQYPLHLANLGAKVAHVHGRQSMHQHLMNTVH